MRDGRSPSRTSDRGFALVVVLLLSAVLGVLGMSLLLMAETEIRISESERLSAQTVYAAEAGTRMVKRWFDTPMSPSNLANPSLAAIDRTFRIIDTDGDPSTAPVAADGTAGSPYYKQGVDRNGDGLDDVFRKPYRDSLLDTLLGTEAGPDMRIDAAASTAARDFLEDLSDRLFSSYPGTGRRARIVRIDVYAPPYARSGGGWVRYGMATVKVIARIYRALPDGTERILAERMVKVVLNEIPYNPGGSLGPLHSCDALAWNGEFTVYWGTASIVSGANLHDNHEKQAVGVPRVGPYTQTFIDLMWGYDDDASFEAYKDAIDGLRIEDPWLRIVSGGAMEEAPNGDPQPWPFTWTPGPLGDGDLPYHPGGGGPNPYPPDWDGTHSNKFQNVPVACPEFDYEFWKAVATSGGDGVHYYVWDHDDYFRENGVGSPQSFRSITDEKTGLFFFDTKDGTAPHDDDADGVPDNLTPQVKISGGTWSVRGMVYLNSISFQTKGVSGRPATFRAPGEPFQDENANGRWELGENWINVEYPANLNGNFVADEGDNLQEDGTKGGPAIRNSRGPSFTADAVLWGILYSNGYYDSTGNARLFGSIISKLGIGEYDPAAGTPEHYWDGNLRTDWPPEGWDLPRVAIHRWETDR